MTAQEINFDGLIGPSHNYGGLSHGNIASGSNALKLSQPKKAALQGLQKMRFLHGLGLKQGILLPHQRPHLPTLRSLGFSGSDKKIIEQASNSAPEILASCYSASAMWAANACTVSPSADSKDGRVHFTPANLSSMFHRSIEHRTTAHLLKKIFGDERYFAHHPALVSGQFFGDEGAANHSRFSNAYGEPGIQLFVFGRYAFRKNKLSMAKFPSRQTYEASLAISRLHQIDSSRLVFAQQNPTIIDAGAFHNDVVSVSNLDTFFYHQEAFVDKASVLKQLQEKFVNKELKLIEVPTSMVSLENAVKSYLFNSQLLKLPSKDGMCLIVPLESKENEQVFSYLNGLESESTAITEVKYVDVRQSMQNGGGPACLRLRVSLNDKELNACNQSFILDELMFDRLESWVNRHYRDQLAPQDLADPSLVLECFSALDELTKIFKLGAFYEFQQ